MKTPAEESAEIARVGLSRTSVLSRNPEFAWFLEQCIEKRMAELDGILHDPAKTPEDRTKALERWDELKKAKAWVPEQMAMFQRTLGQPVN